MFIQRRFWGGALGVDCQSVIPRGGTRPNKQQNLKSRASHYQVEAPPGGRRRRGQCDGHLPNILHGIITAKLQKYDQNTVLIPPVDNRAAEKGRKIAPKESLRREGELKCKQKQDPDCSISGRNDLLRCILVVVAHVTAAAGGDECLPASYYPRPSLLQKPPLPS